MAVSCKASIETHTVSCAVPVRSASLPDGARSVVLGGQNQYVTLTSTDITIFADTFAFNVTVTNLIPQPLGTTNGANADAAGVRVFFHTPPTSTGTGTVNVANEDGMGTFTAVDQEYFQYDGVLAQNATTAGKLWKIRFSPEVTEFTFSMYISAAVQYPDGYIDGHYYVLTLNPGETRALPGAVRSFVGTTLPGEPITWNSDNSALAAVTGSSVTAGGSTGFASISGSAGARPGIYTTAVSVCQATVVAHGTSLPSAISSSDCFSSYGSNSGQPSTSYYADLYRVTLTAGQTITVTMDSGDELDTYLLLAGPTIGELVAGNDDDDEDTLGVGSRIVYTATVSGVYVIEASTFNGLDQGSYTLGVTIS